MKPPFTISEVKPRIFLFEFTNNYDMCMNFLRYQEYYESPSSKYRGKAFDIFDFMRWYSHKYGEGVFTYTDDWDGFNIPGDVIKKVHDLFIESKTIYDYQMIEAWRKCAAMANGDKFYIIGALKGGEALTHEIAHGLFYLYPEYKKEMTKLVKALDPAIRADVNATLKRLGYTPKVYIDETQAYMSTGLSESFKDTAKWPAERKVFEKYFKKFSKGIK